MFKKIKLQLVILVVVTLFISNCASNKGAKLPINGGASIVPNTPIWISGINIGNQKYTKSFPKPEENEYLKVINAGFWLQNTQDKISQLIYSFEINNKKKFPNAIYYTRSSFSNPVDKTKPIIYQGTISNKTASIKITHGTLNNVKFDSNYNMVFEVYSNSNRTNLITRISQQIKSSVDNTSGCVKLEDSYKSEKFNLLFDLNSKLLPAEKISISCRR